MNIRLTSSQISKLAEFFLDVSKGLMLAGILGQGFISDGLISTRIIGAVVVIFLGLLFLNFSLLLERQ